MFNLKPVWFWELKGIPDNILLFIMVYFISESLQLYLPSIRHDHSTSLSSRNHAMSLIVS